MNDISLKLSERTVMGKKVDKIRQEGLVPSVVYGGKTEPLATQSQFVETTKVVQAAGKHSPVHLFIDGKKRLAIIKSIDRDPVKRTVRHIAFQAVKQNEVLTTEVPIVLTGIGESEAEKAGLVVLQALEKLDIKAKPGDLPESIELSILDLASTEDKLTLADLSLPAGVEFADAEQDTELVVANVYEPSALQAANEATGGDADQATILGVENAEGKDSSLQDVETRQDSKDQSKSG